MIRLTDLPSGVTDYHILELIRLMEYREPHLPTVGSWRDTPLRWVHCSVCENARFAWYPTHYRTRICDDCHQALYRVFTHRCTRLVQQAVQRSLYPALHEELLEVCYHPDRVLQTGAIETLEHFQRSSGG